jgi:thiol:disulfide interchange protein DsbC
MLLGLISLASLAADSDIDTVRATVAKILPDVKDYRIVESAVAGLYEVSVGPQIFYVSADGRYLIEGDMLDIETRQNLTEVQRQAGRLEAINGVGEDRMIVFAPQEPRHTVTVFTDIDCGYCRKLHSEIDQYNKLGIGVRYLMYPRAGVGSESYKKAVSVWCADDRQKAMTDAKAGKDVPRKDCDNPVRDHMALGGVVGVTGTPTIIVESGRKLPGYVPPRRLSALLDSQKASLSK